MMRKSQIISLLILLGLVTITIWIGALYDGGASEEIKPTQAPTSGETALPDSETTPAPVISDDEIMNLPTDTITWSPSFSEGRLNITLDAAILERMAQYDCVYDGSLWDGNAAYITFDVGYGDEQNVKNIEAALNALQNTGVKAVFFVTDQFFTGHNIEGVVKRLVSEGHLIGNRGKLMEDSNMSNLTVEEYKAALRTVENGYKAIMGQDAQIKYFRPFGGQFSIRDLAIAKQMGYTTVLWTTLYAGDLYNLGNRIGTELQGGSVLSIMEYCIDGNTDALKSALETAASKCAVKLLGQS